LAENQLKFGFFTSEEDDFRCIADELGLVRRSEQPLEYARHPLVYLVEAADDICYQMMDIEDAHKLKILSTEETKELLLSYFDDERRKRIDRTFTIVSDVNEQIAYLRSSVIGLLIKECTDVFLINEVKILAGTFSGSLITQMSGRAATAYKRCTQVAMEKIYCSREVLDVELAGFRVLSTLVNLMVEAVNSPEKVYSQLLINRVSEQYDITAGSPYERIQAALDYISGMTDVFALDLYRKINGNSLPAV
jgi:dGTPase